MGSIPANSVAQNVPSLRRWRFASEMKLLVHLDSCHLRCRTTPTMSYVSRHDIVGRTYDVVRHIARTMSYVQCDLRHGKVNVVCFVNIVRSCTTSYIGRTTSYMHTVYDIIRQKIRTASCVCYVRHRMYRSYTMSYVHVRCRMSTYDVVCLRTI